MFSHQKSKTAVLFLVGLGFVLGTSQIFATDSSDFNLIADMLHTYIESREQNDYLNKAYSPKFQQDPFGAVMEDLQGQRTEIVLGGMQRITSQLQQKGCSLTQKNLTAILTYFNDDFRAEMSSQLAWKTDQVLNQIPDRDAVEKACVTFNRCYYPEGFKGDIMTDCQKKMLARYGEGYANKELPQKVKLIQLGKDKYWNGSLEDSPYDLVYDVQAISKILFEDIQEPPQFYFFSLPTFLGNWGNGGSSNPSGNGGSNSGGSGRGSSGNGGTAGGNLTEWSEGWAWSAGTEWGGVTPWTPGEGDEEFSDFLNTHMEEGSFQTSSPTTLFGGNICMDEAEIDTTSSSPTLPGSATDAGIFVPAEDTVTDEEYEDYISDIVDQFDDYFDPPPDLPEMHSPVREGGFFTNADSETYEKDAEQVKSCFKNCEGLQLDKKAACMTMCACGEWKTPWFDPYKTPGLWPIMVVKFCAVPPTTKEFSQKGLLVMSIESAFNQIYGVLDTMDKGGELWIFEKQKEFLDSSTKKMNFGKMITFSISGGVKKKVPNNKGSESFVLETLKKDNESMKQALGIVKSLDNAVTRNANMLMQDAVALGTANTYAGAVDTDAEKAKWASVWQKPLPISDLQRTAQQGQYVVLGDEIETFLNQQLHFWIAATNQLKEVEAISKQLSAK